MIGKFTNVAAIGWLIFGGPSWLLAADEVQSRSELIESERIEKEQKLTPEKPPKPEQRFVSVERSIPYRLLTGQVDGWGVGFGNIVPGSGFAIGPQYKRTDLLDGML